MQMVLLIFGILCLAYFFCIAFFVGHGTNFYFIWLLLGCGSILLSILLRKGIWEERFSNLVPTYVYNLGLYRYRPFSFGGRIYYQRIFQIGAKGVGLSGSFRRTDENQRTIEALQYRLDAAIDYLAENPGTCVIVSGGQGSDEHISEAQGMYDYLVSKGISETRIQKEDQSKNTFQNLTFSAEYLNKETDSVGVVSNNFHVFRAVKIAQKAGYQNVHGIAAKGEPFLQLNNMMREFLGVMKDFLMGNM